MKVRNRNRNKKTTTANFTILVLTALVLILIPALSGFSLARKDAGAAGQAGDRFRGVFVTTVNVDEYEAEMEWKNGSLSQPQTVIEGTFDKKKAIQYTDNPLTFGSLPGYAIVTLREKKSGEDFWTNSTYADEEFNESHFGTSVNDNGEDHSVSSCLYAPVGSSITMVLHPIYQRSDGSFYLILGGTAGLASDFTREGESMSTHMSRTNTLRENGTVIKSETVSMEVAIKAIAPVTSARLLQYSRDNRLLDQRPLPLSQQTVPLLPLTSYIIVEETCGEDSSAPGTPDNKIKRSIYTWEDAAANDDYLNHTLFLSDGSHILHPQQLTFVKQP